MSKSDLKEVKCILCGENNYRVLSSPEPYQVVKCLHCGFCYLNPRPADIYGLYSKDYYYDYKSEKVGYADYKGTFEKYRQDYKRIFEKRLRLIQRFKKGGRVLEVGCAYGFLLDFFRKRYWKTHGVEISEEAAKFAREKLKLDVFLGTLEKAAYPDDFFDLILMIDLVEHLPDPVATLSEARRILKEDGVILIQTPWELYHWEKVAEAVLRGQKVGSLVPDAIPVHLYFFQPRTLMKLAKKAGLKVAWRTSGNYGEIRRKVMPPSVESRSPVGHGLKRLYTRSGLQRALYGLAKIFKQGNGIIIFAQKGESSSD